MPEIKHNEEINGKKYYNAYKEPLKDATDKADEHMGRLWEYKQKYETCNYYQKLFLNPIIKKLEMKQKELDDIKDDLDLLESGVALSHYLDSKGDEYAAIDINHHVLNIESRKGICLR